jgi:dihydroxyacid dehydratase/phosphogluconate dehydratase
MEGRTAGAARRSGVAACVCIWARVCVCVSVYVRAGHIQILYGNLAPEGSVAKITGKEGLKVR